MAYSTLCGRAETSIKMNRIHIEQNKDKRHGYAINIGDYSQNNITLNIIINKRAGIETPKPPDRMVSTISTVVTGSPVTYDTSIK